jgi:hypothetical protein
MVNNTSGAIKFLVEAGVLPPRRQPSPPRPPPSRRWCRVGPMPPPPSRRLDGVYSAIHPYAVGARVVHLGEDGDGDLAPALEALVDATVEHLRANPGLDMAPNAADCNGRRDADARTCLERCALRNRVAAEMNARPIAAAAAARAGRYEGCAQATTGGLRANRRGGASSGGGVGAAGVGAAQDRAGRPAPPSPSGHVSPPGRHDPAKAIAKKGGRKKKWNNKKRGKPPRGDETKGRDVAVEFSELDSFD